MSELRIPVPADDPPVGPSAADTYRRLRLAGLSAREAGSLVGHLHGLSTVPGGWAIEEVEHLLFVRELVRTGRMGS
jgi:hypothetical protein